MPSTSPIVPASSRTGIVQVVLSHCFGSVVLPCIYIRIPGEASWITVAVTPNSRADVNALRVTRPRNHARFPLLATSYDRRHSHPLNLVASATEAEQLSTNTGAILQSRGGRKAPQIFVGIPELRFDSYPALIRVDKGAQQGVDRVDPLRIFLLDPASRRD